MPCMSSEKDSERPNAMGIRHMKLYNSSPWLQYILSLSDLLMGHYLPRNLYEKGCYYPCLCNAGIRSACYPQINKLYPNCITSLPSNDHMTVGLMSHDYSGFDHASLHTWRDGVQPEAIFIHYQIS